MRAFPDAPYGAKREPSIGNEVLSLDAPLPGGGRSSERGGYRRGGQQRRGGGRHQHYPGGGSCYREDERYSIKNRLVKLGDQADRLLSSVVDVTRDIDAFVASDFFTWDKPKMALRSEDEVVKIEELTVPDLLKRTLFASPSRPAESDSAFVLSVIVDCVLQLPHKHSFYSTMLMLLLQETVKMAGADVASILKLSYGSSGRLKGETVVVKGETVQDDEDVPMSPLEHSEIKGEMKVAAKVEPQDEDNRVTQNRYKKVLYFMDLVACLILKLKTAMETVWNNVGGIHQVRRLINGFRFVCDLCNLSIIDPAQVLQFIVEQLESCLLLMERTPTVQARALVEHVSLMLVRACFWFHRDIYAQYRGFFDQIKRSFSTIVDSRKARALEEIMACSPIATFDKKGDFSIDPTTLIDEMSEALTSWITHEERAWVSKVIPRLYDTPKLSELRSKPLSILADFQLQMTLSLDHWYKYAADDITCVAVHVQELGNLSSSVQSEASKKFKLPENCLRLKWRESPRQWSCLQLYNDEAVRELVPVEPLGTADIWIIKSYVQSTIQTFFEDLDSCAEHLLLIPVKHDHFVIVMIETVFEACLQPPYGPVPSRTTQRQSSVLLTQLLHRLCVLEKSIIPIVVKGFKVLLDRSDTWDEWMQNILTNFTTQWVTYSDAYAEGIMQTFVSHKALKTFLPRKEELMGEPDTLRDEKPQDVKPGFAEKYIARIRTPLADVGFLQSTQLRFMSNVIERVNRLLYFETFQKKVPDVLTCFIPPQAPLAEHANFFTVSDRETRTFDNIEMMKDLSLSGIAPLESFVVRHMMKLQANTDRHRDLVRREVLNFLRSRVGRPFLANLNNVKGSTLDAMFFGDLDQGVKREIHRVKDQEDEDGRPIKRQRTAEPSNPGASSAVVKVEMVDVDHPNSINVEGEEAPHDPASSENQQITQIKGEMGDGDLVEINDNNVKNEGAVLAGMEYDYIPNCPPFWSNEHLTKLLANSMVAVGSRTLSHSQKLLDLYGQIYVDWMQACLQTEDGQASKLSLDLASRALLEATLDAWVYTSISRLHALLHQFLVAGMICPIALFSILSSPREREVCSFFQTVTGDYLYWDLFDSCLSCIKNGHILKEEIRLYQQNVTDDPDRYTQLFLAALNGCVKTWNSIILTGNSMEAAKPLAISVQTKRILRLLKMAAFYPDSLQKIATQVSAWSLEYPPVAATGILPRILNAVDIFRDAYILAVSDPNKA